MQKYAHFKPFDAESYSYEESFLHQAVQFLSMAGKAYLPEQDDDSQTNVSWDGTKGRIVGREFQDFQMECEPGTLDILINHGGVEHRFALSGKTKNKVYDEIRNYFEKEGLVPEPYNFISHYEIPPHPVDSGKPFISPSEEFAINWTIHRSVANEMMQASNAILGESEIRIWPHHFDTGVYYPFQNEQGQWSIGGGWAIGDTLSPFPYFYFYGWADYKDPDLSGLPRPGEGKWLTEGWKGAILPADAIANANSDQKSIILDFVNEGIETLKNLYGQ